MKTTLLTLTAFLLGALMTVSLSSCRAFSYDPAAIAHRDFKTIKEVQTVTPAGLMDWAEEAETSAPYRKIPYVLCQELAINPSIESRRELAKAYTKIYRKLAAGGYGQKRMSVISEGGEVRVYEEKVKVEIYAPIYLSVVKFTLQRSESGDSPSKGETQLREILAELSS